MSQRIQPRSQRGEDGQEAASYTESGCEPSPDLCLAKPLPLPSPRSTARPCPAQITHSLPNTKPSTAQKSSSEMFLKHVLPLSLLLSGTVWSRSLPPSRRTWTACFRRCCLRDPGGLGVVEVRAESPEFRDLLALRRKPDELFSGSSERSSCRESEN